MPFSAFLELWGLMLVIMMDIKKKVVTNLWLEIKKHHSYKYRLSTNLLKCSFLFVCLHHDVHILPLFLTKVKFLNLWSSGTALTKHISPFYMVVFSYWILFQMPYFYTELCVLSNFVFDHHPAKQHNCFQVSNIYLMFWAYDEEFWKVLLIL